MFSWFASSLLVHLKEGNRTRREKTRKCFPRSEKYFSLKHDVCQCLFRSRLFFLFCFSFSIKKMLNGNFVLWACLRWKRSSFSLCLMKPEFKICILKHLKSALTASCPGQVLTICHVPPCVLCRYTKSNKESYQSRAAVFALCCLFNKHLHIENKPQSVFILCSAQRYRIHFCWQTDVSLFISYVRLYLLIYCSWMNN